MYARLGDIIFEQLIAFEGLTDKRETKYTQLPRISGKPNLQPNGEGLVEFSMSIKFHVAFCNPEGQYQQLDNARRSRTVLPFVFGNGIDQGQFVITTLERVYNQTDALGNIIEIDCNVGLLEYAEGINETAQLEQDRKNAFAVSVNRPLPSDLSTQTDNPALIVAQSNQKVDFAVSEIDNQAITVSNRANAVTSGVIGQAQKFMDHLNFFLGKTQKEISTAQNAIGSISAMISTYTSMVGISSTLPTKLTAVTNSINAINTQITVLQSLPTTISSTGDANTVLTEMNNTLTKVATLKENQKYLNDAMSPIVQALTVKKVMT